MKFFRNLFLLALPFLAACAAVDTPDQPSFEPAPKSSASKFEDRLEMAEAYDRHGLPDKAVEEYQAALAMEPDNVKVLSGLVRNTSSLTRYDEAETYCRRVLELAPDEPEMLYYMAWLSVKQRLDYAAAHAAIDRAIAVTSQKKPYFMQTKGIFFLDEGRNEEAVTAFRGALVETDKTEMLGKARSVLKLDLYKNLGRAYRKLGKEDEAREALSQALAIANSLGISPGQE